MDTPIPGYRYSTGPVHIQPNPNSPPSSPTSIPTRTIPGYHRTLSASPSPYLTYPPTSPTPSQNRTIPGYRYSFGPIPASEDESLIPPTVPPKPTRPANAPTRRLTKTKRTEKALPAVPNSNAIVLKPVPPKRPLGPDHPLVLAKLKEEDDGGREDPPSYAVSYTPQIPTAIPSPTVPRNPPIQHSSPSTPSHSPSSSISTIDFALSRNGTINSVFSKSSYSTASSRGDSYKHVTISSISSISSSGRLSPLIEKENGYGTDTRETLTLTPLSSAFIRSDGTPQPSPTFEDTRLVFSLPPLSPSPMPAKTKPQRRNSCFPILSQIRDHYRQKSEAKHKREQEMADMLLMRAREQTSMDKTPKSPTWLTKDEKRVIEEHRKKVLEERLERALSGRKYRVAHQFDGELKALEAGDEEGGWREEGRVRSL